MPVPAKAEEAPNVIAAATAPMTTPFASLAFTRAPSVRSRRRVELTNVLELADADLLERALHRGTRIEETTADRADRYTEQPGDLLVGTLLQVAVVHGHAMFGAQTAERRRDGE